MPKIAQIFTVFISSPSGLGDERQAAKRAVELAAKALESRGIILKPWLWEENAASDLTRSAQDGIEHQLGSFDLYIGIMEARFGTPTGKYGSGTEQEFENAVKARELGELKGLAFFFKEFNFGSSDLGGDRLSEISKIQDFKSRVGKLGLYKDFRAGDDFFRMVYESILISFQEKDAIEATNQNIKAGSLVISVTFREDFLDAIDVDLAKRLELANLDSLWVEPDLKMNLTSDRGITTEKSCSIADVVEEVANGASVQITGGDTSGKSSICKRMFKSIHLLGLIPVFISGKDIKNGSIERINRKIINSIAEQYESISQAAARQFDRKELVLIIDDFDEISCDARAVLSSLDIMRRELKSIIITANTGFVYAVIEGGEALGFVGSLIHVKISELGSKKRYQAVENWHRSTSNLTVSEEAFRAKVDASRREINRILANHIVPRTPFIVFTLLQAMEDRSSSDLLQKGYVRYYKYLIDTAILRSLSAMEADYAYALLPQIAWAIYQTGDQQISAQVMADALDRFAEKRALRKTNLYSVLQKLKDIGLFDSQFDGEEVLRFRHDFTYNFFLGDYINAHLQEEEMKNVVRSLCENSWSKKTSDILVFLSFHSESPIIINSLLDQLRSCYTESESFSFQSHFSHILGSLIQHAPEQEISRENIAARREKILDAEDQRAVADKADRAQAEPLGQMDKVFSAIEVLGHIIRNHYARLDAGPKQEIFEVGTSAVLRCMGSIIGILNSDLDRVLAIIDGAMAKLSDRLNAKERQKVAKTLVFLIGASFIVHCFDKLSAAVGDENLEITFRDAVMRGRNSTAEFIDTFIKLDTFRHFPEAELQRLVRQIETDRVAMTVLRASVSRRLDMRPPSRVADFHRYCAMVQLKVKDRLVERQRLGVESRPASHSTNHAQQ